MLIQNKRSLKRDMLPKEEGGSIYHVLMPGYLIDADEQHIVTVNYIPLHRQWPRLIVSTFFFFFLVQV